MANILFPVRQGHSRKNQLWDDLAAGKVQWVHTPRFGWECTIDYTDLTGAYATQTITITIPTADFVTGRLVVAFSGGGLGATVNITADAPVGDTEDDLGDTLTAAIDAAIATSLAGVVASVSNTAANTVVVVLETGIGLVTAAPTFTPAQQTTVTWGGTLVNGLYSVRIVSAGPNADVTVNNNRVAGVPANVNAMAAAFETAAEVLIAGDLAGVLVSADDAGAVNTLIFEPGVVATVTRTVTANTTHTFGGTATDGTYTTRFSHSSLPGGFLDVDTVRAAGSPATNTDLADAFEADVEARALLDPLLVTADNTAGANLLTFFDGISGITGMAVAAQAAPAPGTLVVSNPTVVLADATPAGPTVTVTTSITLTLNDISGDQAFPLNAIRSWVMVNVTAAFGANRTITIGDAGDPDGVLGATPVTLNSTGRSGSTTSEAEYQPRPEPAWVPAATIALGSSFTLSAGSVLVEVLWHPNLNNAAA